MQPLEDYLEQQRQRAVDRIENLLQLLRLDRLVLN